MHVIKIMIYVELWIFILIKIEVVISVNFAVHLLESDYLFSFFVHFVEADWEKWSSWNSFIRIRVFFFIVIYSFHVLHLYFFHLIRSSNHASWIHHLMLSIKSTKYKSSSLSTVMSSDSDTCHFIRLCFESSNKLMWNIECIFISSDKLSLYA